MAARNYLVAGGGIAGVTCAEQLSQLDPSSCITLVSASPLIKAATNFRKVGRTLEDFEVMETTGSHLSRACPNVRVCNSAICSLDAVRHEVHLEDGNTLIYDKMCICTGARPKLIADGHPQVLGIRDTESVVDLTSKMATAQRIVVVGNGGIAMELVYEIKNCQVIWAIKDDSIGTTFFDEGAARFFLSTFEESSSPPEEKEKSDKASHVLIRSKPMKRMRYMLDSTDRDPPTLEGEAIKQKSSTAKGSALGPDWSSGLDIAASHMNKNVHIEYKCEVDAILSGKEIETADLKETQIKEFDGEKDRKWPVYIKLTNGSVFGCDLVVSATGVTPALGFSIAAPKEMKERLTDDDDKGILVDKEMRTCLPNLYAAGDVCTVNWEGHTPLWFQMRLWSQARQMGAYAAKCMTSHVLGEPVLMDFCFELFAHVTRFFGYKVVLLGKYNAQGLGQDYELLLRFTKGVEYIKVVLQNGRMVGAVLVGDTELEETFENLILNQMDLSRFGEDLLNPDIDIEDYFD